MQRGCKRSEWPKEQRPRLVAETERRCRRQEGTRQRTEMAARMMKRTRTKRTRRTMMRTMMMTRC